ncbi:MAG: hypothetical protein SGPRY_010872 [Prymnesium sp.]
MQEAIDATPTNGSVRLYLPPGSLLSLGGAPIVIGQIDALIASEGEGARLDAEHASRVFEVRRGAHLELRALTLANGHSRDLAGELTRIVGWDEFDSLLRF